MEKERNPRGLFLRKAVFCLGEHELYSVQLVYFRSPGVIINGNNICLRISFFQSFYNAFSHNMVRKTGKRLYFVLRRAVSLP